LDGAKDTIRRLERDPLSPLARHALGLGVLLLTIVPAYAYFGSRPQPDSEIMKMAREAIEASDSSVEVPEIVEIEAHIREVAVRYDIPPILVAAIVEAESEFNPRAVSRRGARGLMQLMPGTASSLKVSDTFDPYENIEGGVRHLRGLMDRYHGNLPLVLAAYNAGEQAVMAYGGVPPYRETRRYVSRILRRIGRADLVPRVSSVSPHVVPVATTSRIDPGFTWAVASPSPTPSPTLSPTPSSTPSPTLSPTPSPSSPRSAWAERLALERQVPAKQVPAKIERSVAAAPADLSDGAREAIRSSHAHSQGP
jgi:Transglycosylase SLT domain